MSTANVELVREGMEAINRRDAEWLIEHSDPEIEMRMQGVAGEPVLYRGHAGIREYLRDVAESWQSVEFVPEQMRDLGQQVLAVVTQRARGRASGIEVEARAGVLCEVRDGKATRMRSYRDPAEALAEAGIEAQGR